MCDIFILGEGNSRLQYDLNPPSYKGPARSEELKNLLKSLFVYCCRPQSQRPGATAMKGHEFFTKNGWTQDHWAKLEALDVGFKEK